MQAFEVDQFKGTPDPYSYMLECGFGTSAPKFEESELLQLVASISNLNDVQTAFAFAIGEQLHPALFAGPAIEHLLHEDLSIRIAALNCLAAIPRGSIRSQMLQRIRSTVAQMPEATDFAAHFD